MDIIVDIFVIILLISASVLCIYLIKYIKEITISFKNIEHDLHEISEKTIPILANIEATSKTFYGVANEIEAKVDESINFVENLRDRVGSFVKGGSLRVRDENPIRNLIINLTAITKGISAFLSRLKD
ncbi:MAG: hypothetical protein JEY94_01900 [Melioribacteraceae bacterium]|nr:hypothetical protein [Melioribacteraceae bacterium]